MARRLLLVSSSRCHPYGYLDHCEDEVRSLFSEAGHILFVPYARPDGSSHEAYTAIARPRFEKMGFEMTGIHEHQDPRSAVEETDGVFIGGGNTFVLLRELYRHDLLGVLRSRIAGGMPYMGTSAGSNVAGLSMGTSNDMPIVFPPSFETLGAVRFNLNPHYPRETPDPTHKGETRDDRIREFHVFNPQPVVALYEDGMLRVEADRITLVGERPALLFRAGHDVEALPPGSLPRDLLGDTA